MNTRNKPWRLTILQGVSFLLTGFLLFTGIEITLKNNIPLIAMSIIVAGCLGISEWCISKNFDRNFSDILWSALCIVEGFFLFVYKNQDLHFLYNLLGGWLLASSFWITFRSWELHLVSPLGWGVMVAGVIFLFLGTMILLAPDDIDKLNSSIIISCFLLFGLALLMLANIKKWMMQEG